MRNLLAPLGLNPPKLADSIGYLAHSWIKRWGERTPSEADWQGLLLLTTRVDLALESALARQANVSFTRILPTLNFAENRDDLRRLVQQWSANPNWTPDVSPAGRDSAPSENIAAPSKGQLAKFPLDKAKRVILVKLCGTLEIPESLLLTAYEYFGNSSHFDSLPPGINEAIGTSPHLILGRGLASPLAQLIRHKLIDRHRTKQPRLVLLPMANGGDSSPGDPLCDLDLTLLTKDEQTVIGSLNASAIHRGPEHDFVRRLAERI
jgi:hypothetical protein